MPKHEFRTLALAIEFHRACQAAKLPGYLRDRLLRASSSVALNLAEGDAKPTRRDQLRFFFIALGSLRECQVAIKLMPKPCSVLAAKADSLGACLYRLTH
jgi:four helix bundle protein